MSLRERVRGTFNWAATTGFILLFAPVAVLSGVLNRRHTLGAWCKRAFGRAVFTACGVRAAMEGEEHVPLEGGFVLVSNHESHFDGPFLVGWFPRSLSIVAKQELFRIPVLGQGFRGLGLLEMDRGNRRSAMASLESAVEFVAGGGVMLVFPEGHRTLTGEMEAFQAGAFVLALKAGVPILPVGVAGTREILTPHRYLPRPGPAHLAIGEPIPTVGLSIRDRRALMADTWDRVARLREQARAKVAAERAIFATA